MTLFPLRRESDCDRTNATLVGLLCCTRCGRSNIPVYVSRLLVWAAHGAAVPRLCVWEWLERHWTQCPAFVTVDEMWVKQPDGSYKHTVLSVKQH